MCKCLKKFFLPFLVLISVFSISVSASAPSYSCYYQKPQLNGKNFYLEFITSNGWQCLLVGEGAAFGSGASISLNFSAEIIQNHLYIFPSEKSLFVNGEECPIRCSGYIVNCQGNWVDSVPFVLTPAGTREGLRVNLADMGSITGIHGYNCSISFSSGIQNFVFAYGNDNTINSKLDSIISAIENIGGAATVDPSKQPSQDDKNTIDDTEKKQDSLIGDTDPTNDINNINDSVISFIKSAPSTLSFAKSIFERLVVGHFSTLVFASISLAVFPLLLGFFKGAFK